MKNSEFPVSFIIMIDGTTYNAGFDPSYGDLRRKGKKGLQAESWQLTAPCCRVTQLCASDLNPLRTEMTRGKMQASRRQKSADLRQRLRHASTRSRASVDCPCAFLRECFLGSWLLGFLDSSILEYLCGCSKSFERRSCAIFLPCFLCLSCAFSAWSSNNGPVKEYWEF